MTPPDRLSETLKSWQTAATHASPDFRAAVWSRIEAGNAPAHSPAAPDFADWFTRLTRPAIAAALLIGALATGSGVAYAYDSLTENERIAAKIAQSIDPIQMHQSE